MSAGTTRPERLASLAANDVNDVIDEDFTPVFSPDFCAVSASLLMFSFRIALSEFNFEWCLVGWPTESYSVCSPTNGVRIILS